MSYGGRRQLTVCQRRISPFLSVAALTPKSDTLSSCCVVYSSLDCVTIAFLCCPMKLTQQTKPGPQCLPYCVTVVRGGALLSTRHLSVSCKMTVTTVYCTLCCKMTECGAKISFVKRGLTAVMLCPCCNDRSFRCFVLSLSAVGPSRSDTLGMFRAALRDDPTTMYFRVYCN